MVYKEIQLIHIYLLLIDNEMESLRLIFMDTIRFIKLQIFIQWGITIHYCLQNRVGGGVLTAQKGYCFYLDF